MSYEDYNDPRPDPIREGIRALLIGLGWGLGLIGFGLAVSFSNGINPF